MIDFLFCALLSLNIFFTLIVLFNFFSPLNLQVPKSTKLSLEKNISVLIPARNEEDNIKNCLEDVFKQDLEHKEVICLDDDSTDDTFNVLLDLKKRYGELRIIQGKELPDGWTGKNWACYQLAVNSTGDFLVFIDADVRLKKFAIKSAISLMEKYDIKMLSIFPTQVMRTIGEYLIVPLMNWFLLTFLPLIFVRKISHSSFVAANGQFMIFRRDAYFKIGGHQAVKNKIVEDMELARLMKKNNCRIMTLLGGDLVTARMYNSFLDGLNGFSKNFFSGFNTSYFKFSFFLFFILIVFLTPFLLVFIDVKFFIVVGLILIQRVLISKKSNQNIFINLLLLPLQLLMVLVIGIRSMILTNRGELNWKGRNLSHIK